MRSVRCLIGILAVAVVQQGKAADPDRSSPEATVQSLQSAIRNEDFITIAECVTPDSDERAAAEMLGHLLTGRKKLDRGNVAHRLAAGRISQFLSEKGIGKNELIEAALTASDRPQSSALLMLAIAIQKVEHKPRFAAAAAQQLKTVCGELQIPFRFVKNDQDQHWVTSRVMDFVIEWDQARVDLASDETDKTVQHRFTRIDDHWLLQRPNPLPPEILDIVNGSASAAADQTTSAIVVNRASTQFPESVYLLAKRAWINEDLQAFAECMTADSLEAQAVMTMLLVHAALQNDETPDDVRKQLQRVLQSSEIDEGAVSKIMLDRVKEVLQTAGTSESDRTAGREISRNAVLQFAALIDHKPRYCAAAQAALLPIQHGQGVFELFHLRHVIRQLGNELNEVKIDGISAVGTIPMPDGKSGALQFVNTEDGWRLSLPFPVPDGELPKAPLPAD